MEKNIFKIAFVTKKGKIMYYGYNKFPYLTHEPNLAYEFSTSFYKTSEKQFKKQNDLNFFSLEKTTKQS